MQHSIRHILLVDSTESWANLLPLTFTRPCGALRIGIDTIAGKWTRLSGLAAVESAPGAPYLDELYPHAAAGEDTLCVDGTIVPDSAFAAAAIALETDSALTDGNGRRLAWRGNADKEAAYAGKVLRIEYVYDIFRHNGEVLAADFAAMTAGATGQPLSPTNTVVGNPRQVFVAEGATVECAVLNVKNGPIYIGAGAEVMEGALMRGPIAIGEGSTVNMGAKIYGATTLGPHCKVGGELNNVVMQGYSNKAHDGFLGNAVVGEWCNLGAGCVASNLKNNYVPVKLWNYPAQRFLPTGLQFCGLIMGDHCKAGINTMFNTGTVLGIGVNVHQAGFPRNFVANFSDGGSFSGFDEMSVEVFLDTARRVMARRDVVLTAALERVYRAIHAGDYRELL